MNSVQFAPTLIPECEFSRVSESNDWGSVVTFVGRQELSAKTGGLTVLFPDGVQQWVRLNWREYSEHVNDMGHESDVRSLVPYFKIVHHGLKCEIPLATAGLRVALRRKKVGKK